MIDRATTRAARLVDELRSASRKQRTAVLTDFLREEIALRVGLLPDDIGARDGFMALGIDSLRATELRVLLDEHLGASLPSSLLFDFPTIETLTEKLADALEQREQPGQPAAAVDPIGERGVRPVDEPIAIVGMGCRFPGGVRGTQDYWRLLIEGIDATTDVPNERWRGGFLSDKDRFDCAFFNIAPREAPYIDPQHRMLLEVAWETFESAGVSSEELYGSDTGVFIGITTHDYFAHIAKYMSEDEIDISCATGVSAAVASGRISYVFGLRGPSVTLDTACSSALVAVHLACESLRRGECRSALAGAAAMILSPLQHLFCARAQMLAPDGRCKSFDESADGYGRSEGIGVVLLKRVSDALRDGDSILAVIAGSAVNQDGASGGLTVPNGPAQQRVIQSAIRRAGLSEGDIDYVEAHGSGTPLGDPVEMHALGEVFSGSHDASRPLWVGSAKSNLGHMEAAAGMGGLIKAVLQIKNATIAPNLHFTNPSSKIQWARLPVKVPTGVLPWPAGRPRRAGVSSFGMSGTNAHVVLEQAPAVASFANTATGEGEAGQPAYPAAGLPVLFSGRTEDALRAQAQKLRDHLETHPDRSLLDLAYSLAVTRTHFEHRAAVVARSRSELFSALESVARGEPAARAVLGRSTAAVGGKVVFVFPGQGSQWAEMARLLLDASEVFREQISACERAFSPYVDWSLGAVLEGREAGARGASLDRVDVVQPVLFAVMVSLAALWRAMGVVPDAVVGHSQGEIAAAFVAGALSLEDAAKVVTLRSRALTRLAGKGAMAAVQLAASELQAHIDASGARERLSIASINSPRATVVSGDSSAVDALLDELTAKQVFARKVRVDYASHGAQIEQVEDELLAELSSIVPRATSLPFYSTVTRTILEGTALDAGYWYRNLRQTVCFADAAEKLFDDGHRFFLEVSPHPVLTLALLETFERLSNSSSGAVTVVGSLRRDEGDFARFALSAGELHVRGLQFDWGRFFGPLGARRVDLPTYAFQRERYWFEPRRTRNSDITSFGLFSTEHPLVGAAVPLADGDGFLLTGRLSLHEHPWLSGHVVFGTVIVPGTAFLELALAAAHHVGLERVGELTLEVPLTLPSEGGVDVQVSVDAPDAMGRRSFAVHARPVSGAAGASHEGRWTRHARGTLDSAGSAGAALAFELRAWPPPGATAVALEGLYTRLSDAGLAYGPEFRGLRAVWVRGDELFAEVELPPAAAKDAGRFTLHPALLDAALHALAVEHIHHVDDVALPFAWSGVSLCAVGASTLRARVVRSNETRDAVSLELADTAGEPVARIESLICRPASAEHVRKSPGAHRDALWRVEWTPLPKVGSMPNPRLEARVDRVDRVALVDPERTLDLTDALAMYTDLRLERYPHFAALQGALDDGAVAPDAIVIPWLARCATSDVVAAAHEAAESALGVLQAWLADERLAACRLVFVTRGVVAVDIHEDVSDLVHAPIWGLTRSAQTENPLRPIVLVDLDGSDDARRHLLSSVDLGETELALRGAHRLAPRMARVPAEDSLRPPAHLPDLPWRLDVRTRGTLESLEIVEHADVLAPLAPGQVRIAVHAAGINFRDVVDALGMIAGEREPLGGEGAGLVLEVGPGVTDVGVGDRVMGLIPAAFGPVAVTDHRLIVRVPVGWSLLDAAGVCVTFLTAYHALVDLAHLDAGERVLVHAAAGGVGMAATQLARHLGAEVFATASPGKWETLRALGFDAAHMASSRTTEFEAHFLRATEGRGVDVVLDSLAREFVDASLRLLPRGGRFIEMGKTDIRDANSVAADHPGVAYRAFDLIDAGPDRIQEMLRELMSLFARGVLRPLPVTPRDIRHAPQAFRAFAQARHVGKVVFTLPRPIDRDGTVLITGGTGLLGALLARHLVHEHGAKHLLLTSRQGSRARGARDLQAELEALGACVTVAECDVADRSALAALLGSIPREHPLTAVIHAAGTLDDGVLTSLTPSRLHSVLRAKIDGAVHLHELTRSSERELSAFVLFSALSGVLGAPGQANYAAANAFLDALAHHRSARGLTAMALDWGYWAERSTMTAHLTDADVQRMARSGVVGLSSHEGLALFDAALSRPDAVLVPARFDLGALAAHAVHPAHPARESARPSVLRSLSVARASRPVATNTARSVSFEQRLLAMPPEGREEALRDIVRTEAAIVLGMAAPGSLDLERPLPGMGLDSLMGLELRNRLMTATGLRLPPTFFFEAPTVRAAAAQIARRMGDSNAASPPSAALETVIETNGLEKEDRGEHAMMVHVKRLWQSDDVEIGDELLAASARVRRAREAKERPHPPPTPSKSLQLARGAASPSLFCISPLVPIPASMTYARFASALDGSRDVWGLSHPGYALGERLPPERDAVARVEAEEIVRAAAGRPFAVMGYSAGGWIAHDVVQHLERAGVFPGALVLIDTYTMHGVHACMESIFARHWLKAFPWTEWADSELTAYAWYRRLYAGWRPGAIATRTLFARVTEPMPGMENIELLPGSDWRASWAGPHDGIEVPGHHFDALSDYAGPTGRAIDDWLAGIAQKEPRFNGKGDDDDDRHERQPAACHGAAASG